MVRLAPPITKVAEDAVRIVCSGCAQARGDQILKVMLDYAILMILGVILEGLRNLALPQIAWVLSQDSGRVRAQKEGVPWYFLKVIF